MVLQVLFPVFLYLLGLLPILFLRRRVATIFVAWTAFAWGALLWAISALLCLLLPFVPFSLPGVVGVLLFGLGILLVWRRRQLALPDARTARAIALPMIIFAILVAAGAQFVPLLTNDGIMQLLVANQLAAGAPGGHALADFGYWGVMLLMLQAPAPWFGQGYFSTVHVAYVITLAFAYVHTVFLGLGHLGVSGRARLMMTSLSALTFAATPYILFQAIHLHNNIVTATYLFIGAGLLWRALAWRSRHHLYLGLLALVGLSLARTETTLFATIFIVAAMSLGVFDKREWLKGLLPYAALLFLWNLWLFLVPGPQTHILTPPRIAMLILAVAALPSIALLSDLEPVRHYVMPRLHLLLLLALVLILALTYSVETQRLLRSARSIPHNHFWPGWTWWGFTWWLAAVVFLLIPHRRTFPAERLMVVGILGFWLLLLDFSLFHGLRHGWGGSGDRAAIHILPLILTYLTFKSVPLLPGSPAQAP